MLLLPPCEVPVACSLLEGGGASLISWSVSGGAAGDRGTAEGAGVGVDSGELIVARGWGLWKWRGSFWGVIWSVSAAEFAVEEGDESVG